MYFKKYSDGSINFQIIIPCYKDKPIAQIGGVKGSVKNEYHAMTDKNLIEFFANKILTLDYTIHIEDC